MNNEKKHKIIIWVMIMIILILLLFIIYSFIFLPAYNNLIVKKQAEAQQVLIYGMMQQIQQQGYVSIPLSQNETLVLVPQSNYSYSP